MNKVDKEGAKAGDGAGEEEGASVEAWDMLGGSVGCVEGSGGSSSGSSSGGNDTQLVI